MLCYEDSVVLVTLFLTARASAQNHNEKVTKSASPRDSERLGTQFRLILAATQRKHRGI